MTRQEFAQHVSEAIEAVIQFAEQKSGRKLSRRFIYKKLSRLKSSDPPINEEDIVEYLVEQHWRGENEIYPCFDLGVADVLKDGTLVLSGNRAGYPPRPCG